MAGTLASMDVGLGVDSAAAVTASGGLKTCTLVRDHASMSGALSLNCDRTLLLLRFTGAERCVHLQAAT